MYDLKCIKQHMKYYLNLNKIDKNTPRNPFAYHAVSIALYTVTKNRLTSCAAQ